MTAQSSKIRVMAVDDHPALREGIAMILANEDDMVLIGEADDGRDAIAKFETLRPDITLMDLQMPGMGGIEAVQTICASHPGAKIIILTTYEGDAQAVRALKAGASSFLIKSALRRELLEAIRAVHAGRRYLTPSVAQEIALHSADDMLTAREISILRLVAEGKSNKLIAWDLKISDDTVKTHLRSVFSKLNARDRTQAVTAALRRGIIEL